MTIKTKSILLIFAIIILGCKDEFLLESKGFKSIMVVDGLISNEASPYTIKLSTSSPINTLEKFPYENCIVTLYENTDKFEVLKENKGNWNRLFNGIKKISETIKVINVDKRLCKKIEFINSIGLSNTVNQYEMEMEL